MRSFREQFPRLTKQAKNIGIWWTILGPGGVLSVIMGWAASGFAPIAKLGWGAVVFAGVGAACLIMLVLAACFATWRYFNPIPQRLSPYDRSAYTYDPATGAPNQEAYFGLVDFVVQYLWPACDGQIDLQKAIIKEEKADDWVTDLAIANLSSDARPNARTFWVLYDNLLQGIEGSEPTIKFDVLVDYINRLENNAYKNFRDLTEETAGKIGIPDLKLHPVLGPVWEQWRERHNKLVDEHKRVKQNPRFGRKVYRPNQPVHWGEKIPPL